MSLRIRRRLHAQRQLEEIVDRIASHDVDAAIRFIDAVEHLVALLAEMPELRFLVFYLVEGNALHLVDVVDARTDYSIKKRP